MHDDIMFRWGSLPDVHGLDVVKGMFDDLYTKVCKMRHRVFATHVVGDVTFAQGQAAFELFSGEAYYGDYADVVNWLQSLELVDRARVERLEEDVMMLRLEAQADPAQLSTLIELDRRLLPVPSTEAGVQLRYQWQN